MQPSTMTREPRRITDLIDARAVGADVRLDIAFEILPADFHHRSAAFKAYIFLAKFSGAIEDRPFDFRKCYARGCPNNLCTHVSQAVTIANRYLQRDYDALTSAGIAVAGTLFTLDDMIVKFETLKQEGPVQLTIPDLTGMARSGKPISVAIVLEMIPAVEHFSHAENAQTFLSGEFDADVADETYHCHRCFACFATDCEAEEKQTAIRVANARLAQVYREFDTSGIAYQPKYFE